MVEPAEWKVTRVGELKDLVLGSDLVGVASIDGIPGPQIQKMRTQLRGRARMVVSKNNLIARALREAAADREKVDGLVDAIAGQTALILGSGNPFILYQVLEGTKVKAPAKGGEVATEDILVAEGDTPFKPGPVVGDLQRAGLPAAIEGGKVVIKKDKLLVEQGKRIPKTVAQVLTKLEIFPVTVGPRLQAAYEAGTVYPRDTLAIDTAGIRADFATAAAHAFHLAVEAAYPTPLTIRNLLTKAHARAVHLAMETATPTSETLPALLRAAQTRMLAVASRAPDALDDELKAMLSAAPAAEAKEEAPEEKEKKDEKKEEKVDEEEAAAGLSSLFG